MGNKKLLDLVQATGEEAVDWTISDILPEVVKCYGETVVSEGVAMLAGELVGAVCPRLNNIRLSYKQNRLERNVSIMLERLVQSEQSLADRVSVLEETVEGRALLQNSSEMLLDNIVDEIQPNKVKYSVNGYVNLLQTDNVNFDIALSFFKTLSQLNEVDIRVLQNYDWTRSEKIETLTPFNSSYDYEQIRYIKEKLTRLGLLRGKNQEIIDKNQDQVIEYLQAAYKDANSRKPKGVKLPKFKKVATSDTYRITSLGYSLLQLISEQCNMEDLSVPEDEDGE